MSTVLVVDDNAATRALVRGVAEADGMAFLEACRGSDARALVARTTPDVILLDLGLPDVSGADLVADLRARLGAHVPILALTGIASAESRRAFSAFDDVVSKPLDAERLRVALRGCLPDEPTAPKRFGEGRTLIVADDDAVQRKMVAFKLGRLGFSVRTACDGREAIALAMASKPDAVVSDVLMPNVDGFELCSLLRADDRFARVPILLLSNSYVEESDRAFAMRVGADAYVIRHPELVELTDSLRRSLDAPPVHPTRSAIVEPEAQRERTVRAARQLDKQVAQNAALAQRTAILAAQLAILGGLTSALAENRDVDAAMDAALSSCFDAGNISWGVLLVREGAAWRERSLGLDAARARALAEAAPNLIERVAPQPGGRPPVQRFDPSELLADAADLGKHAIVAPIVHVDEPLGVIVLGSRAPFDEQRTSFATVVAGQTAMVLALARAFQERERAIERERERAEQLSSILDAIGDPLLFVDDRCRPLRWNAAGAPFAAKLEIPRIKEWPAIHGLYQADQSTLYRWDELPFVRAARGEAIDDAPVCVQVEGAEAQWLSVTARPVRASDAETLRGAVAVVRDVTQEKRANERQIVNDRMASIGVLAAGIAHEINNPMTSVLAELDMAIEDAAPGLAILDQLRAARDAALRVTTIVRDLKTLSRGGPSEESAAVDLRRVIDAAVRMAAPETRQRATLTIEVDDMPRVLGNESRLVQVLLNLLVNAAQSIGEATARPVSGVVDLFAPPRPPDFIRVRGTTASDGGALLTVSDSGGGMPPEVRARLFTPFFTTKPVGAGTGLGLSISHRIVAGLGGTIECDSSPETGTVFRVWLPKAPAGAPLAAPPSPTPPRRERLRVVVVDPDPLTRQLLARALRADYELALVESAGAAPARGEAFDLVLWAARTAEEADGIVERVTSAGDVRALILLVPRELARHAAELASARGASLLVKPLHGPEARECVRRRAELLFDLALEGARR